MSPNMNDIYYPLSERVTIQSVVRENSLWIEDKSAELSVMLPLNTAIDVTYFEDDQNLVLAYPNQWSCVSVRTTRSHAEKLAESLNRSLEVYEVIAPDVEDHISMLISEELEKRKLVTSRRPLFFRKGKRRK